MVDQQIMTFLERASQILEAIISELVEENLAGPKFEIIIDEAKDDLVVEEIYIKKENIDILLCIQ